MSITAWTGIAEDGQIRLTEAVCLPEKTLVYVVVPEVPNEFRSTSSLRISSPRLANPKQASDFVKAVTLENENAGL